VEDHDLMHIASSKESFPFLLAAAVSSTADSDCDVPHQVVYKTVQGYVVIFFSMQWQQKKLLVAPEGTRKPHVQCEI
jgi:hypothetical protein